MIHGATTGRQQGLFLDDADLGGVTNSSSSSQLGSCGGVGVECLPTVTEVRGLIPGQE